MESTVKALLDLSEKLNEEAHIRMESVYSYPSKENVFDEVNKLLAKYTNGWKKKPMWKKSDRFPKGYEARAALYSDPYILYYKGYEIDIEELFEKLDKEDETDS